MSGWISYQGNPLGRIKMHESLSKMIFIAENLECLERLFKLNSGDEIESESQGKMNYEQFRKNYFSKICAFYPTLEDWMLKNEVGRTPKEHEKYKEAKRE